MGLLLLLLLLSWDLLSQFLRYVEDSFKPSMRPIIQAGHWLLLRLIIVCDYYSLLTLIYI